MSFENNAVMQAAIVLTSTNCELLATIKTKTNGRLVEITVRVDKGKHETFGKLRILQRTRRWAVLHQLWTIDPRTKGANAYYR